MEVRTGQEKRQLGVKDRNGKGFFFVPTPAAGKDCSEDRGSQDGLVSTDTLTSHGSLPEFYGHVCEPSRSIIYKKLSSNFSTV